MFSTLRKNADENDEDWDEYTDGVLFAINTNRSNTTKFSPFYLMCGRHPRLPLGSPKVCRARRTIPTKLKNWQENLFIIYLFIYLFMVSLRGKTIKLLLCKTFTHHIFDVWISKNNPFGHMFYRSLVLFWTTAIFGKSHDHGRKNAETQIINFVQ